MSCHNDRYSAAHDDSHHNVLQVLTEACGRLIREGKTPSRLYCVGLLGVVKEDPKVHTLARWLVISFAVKTNWSAWIAFQLCDSDSANRWCSSI